MKKFEITPEMEEELKAMGAGSDESESESQLIRRRPLMLAAAFKARKRDSKLARKAIWNNNYWLRPPYRIEKVCPHIMCAPNWTADTCGHFFQGVKVSSNYGIGVKGDTDQYVEEKYGAFAQGSKRWNQRVVSIEMANSTAGPEWKVSADTLESCIELIADIMIRNRLGHANYTGDLTGNLIEHCMTASTACPGPYVHKKMSHIEAEVNMIIDGKLRLPETGYYKRGDYGRSVRILQRWLRTEGFYKGPYRGDFGSYKSGTMKAVEKFERKYGLEVDGFFGRECFNKYLEIRGAKK